MNMRWCVLHDYISLHIIIGISCIVINIFYLLSTICTVCTDCMRMLLDFPDDENFRDGETMQQLRSLSKCLPQLAAVSWAWLALRSIIEKTSSKRGATLYQCEGTSDDGVIYLVLSAVVCRRTYCFTRVFYGVLCLISQRGCWNLPESKDVLCTMVHLVRLESLLNVPQLWQTVGVQRRRYWLGRHVCRPSQSWYVLICLDMSWCRADFLILQNLHCTTPSKDGILASRLLDGHYRHSWTNIADVINHYQ